MPKLLKSLFPARDEKKELRPSPHNQQVSRQCSSVQLRILRSSFNCVNGGAGWDLVSLAKGIEITNVQYIISSKLC